MLRKTNNLVTITFYFRGKKLRLHTLNCCSFIVQNVAMKFIAKIFKPHNSSSRQGAETASILHHTRIVKKVSIIVLFDAKRIL